MKNINEVESFNQFEMETNVPYTLNFLIFMQNIFLNKNQNRTNLYFPYIDTSEWGLLSNNDFLITYKENWEIATKKNASNRLYDHNDILDVDKKLFKRLFECNEKGNYGFSESKKSFLAWWDGIYGKIAIQSVINEDITNKLYKDLSLSIQHKVSPRRLKIDLLYDNPILVDNYSTNWYSTIPIEQLYMRKNRANTLKTLLKCCGSI
jgi:hypothetical protein